MRTAPLLVSAALLFTAWPFLARLPAVPSALVAVGLAVLLAVAASGGMSAMGAATGALGAFAAGLIAPAPTILGGAILLGACYAERTTRVRGRVPRAAHVGMATVAGGIAAGLIVAYAHAPWATHAVAIVVASVLACVPRLVDAEDLVAHALDAIAHDVAEPAKSALVAGAELRRSADDGLLDRATARTVRKTWRALVKLGEARARVEQARAVRAVAATATPASPTGAVLAMLDRKISDHVAALARAYAAVDTARAAELGLDDVALRTVESAGETLEHVSRAMVDVDPVDRPPALPAGSQG